MMKRISVWSLIFVAALLLAGCGHEYGSHHDKADADDQMAGEHAPIEVTEAMAANLAAADLVDGAEDHLVENCPMCAFAMAGSDQHVAKVGDYSLQFCSSHCKASFEKDLAGSVVAMAVPEAEDAADPAP